MTPGLSAWETRRRNQRRQWRNRAILLLGIAGAGLYAMPPDLNPLVHAGVLAPPQAPREIPIENITLAIPVRTEDLPKRRPSLADARSADQIEVAQVVGLVPNPMVAPSPAHSVATATVDDSMDLNQSGSGEPIIALVTTSSEPPLVPSVTTPRKSASSPTLPAAKPPMALVQPDEDITTMRKRVFSGDR